MCLFWFTRDPDDPSSPATPFKNPSHMTTASTMPLGRGISRNFVLVSLGASTLLGAKGIATSKKARY